ncbi:MAG: RraA family protein [Thermoleophilia bacterium]|nr:RraA family protein [Thermoleophilia bacterium]
MGIDALRTATSAIVADALDRIGLRAQVLDPAIRPLWPSARVVGRVYPVVIIGDESEPTAPYAGEMDALEALGEDHVPLFEVEAGVLAASWGELFACGAVGRGARGVVVDGMIRDSAQLEQMQFPTFNRGFSPLDTLKRAAVSHHGGEATVGGVHVHRGDVVVGDRDGIVVIPASRLSEVAELVGAKRALEQSARDDLLAGMGIHAVWDKYRVF